MSFDLVIRNGLVFDGTGAEGRRADVAIRDGRIAEIGALNGVQARRTIDADGHIVTPGFVDIHTHYDGQVSWDDELAPSCFHGVTTAVMGNCGVGFAPVRAADRDRLVELMEGVEDIPGTALSEGITWDWESFPEYMEALDRRPHVIDFAAQIPHDAVRVFVMGDRAVAEEAATDDDIAQMRALVREALEAGALGFSTGRTDNHRDARGRHTPAAEATARELQGIAGAFEGLDHGVLQAVSDFDMVESPDEFDREFDLLRDWVAAAHGHPLSISLLQRVRSTHQWKRIIERAEQANDDGLVVRLQVAARGIGVLLGLDATFHPFIGFPSYKAIAGLPLAERVARMRDPEFKQRLLSETSDRVSGDGSSIPPLADQFLANLEFVAMKLYRLGEGFDYEPAPNTSVLAAAQARGVPVLELVYDLLLEDDGRELLYFPIYNYNEFNLDAVHEMLTHPLALQGLSDGGAHVGTICDASFPTYMLMHWARDRARDRIALPRVVRMLTGANAEYLGMHDRGTLEVGKRADVNVIDFEGLRLPRPRLLHDLPAGGKRLMQHAHGYRATLVGGDVIVENDALTEARPGRLVRMGSGRGR